MIVKIPEMLHNIVSKQFKISHVPCNVIVFKKDDIPSNIKTKIDDQYDEKFLDDSDIVMFIKGPIDKAMRKKIFKATDKALGEGANMMNEQDFKLLKLNNSDNIDDEDENATIDKQVNDIINEPDDGASDDGNDVSAAKSEDDNSNAIDDAISEAVVNGEDNSPMAMIHQGKSIAQWVKDFKGEFTPDQVVTMALSGQDLIKIGQYLAGNVSVMDSELNEASKSADDDGENDDNNDDDEDDVDNDEADDATDADETDDDNEDDDGEADSDDNDDDEDDESDDQAELTVPTRFVFLKISMK